MNLSRIAPIVLLATLAGSTPLPIARAAAEQTSQPVGSLQTAVQAAAARHHGTIGVIVTSLDSGESFSMNADLRFRSASLYKLFVLDAAEAAIEAGTLDPSEILTVTDEDAAEDPYTDLQVGTRASVDCALQTMVEMSGNSAADLLVRRLGLSNVTARMQAQGFVHSTISTDSAFTSPGDVARLLEAIARGQAVSGHASRRVLDLLLAQQHNDRLPAPLPLSVKLAHKTGELPGLRHDAGIVFAPSGTYVVVAMIDDAPDVPEGRAAIVDISRSAYAALASELPPEYLGLPPRLSQAILRLPDAQGRLQLLGDPRTETAVLPADVNTTSDAQDPIRARPELVDSLRALQKAAADAGYPFWVRSGFVQPTDADAAKALPTEWLLPCAVEQPARTPDHPAAEEEVAAAQARQAWLGTALSISDREDGSPTTFDDRASPTWQWLMADAAEFGFVPGLPETADATIRGHQTWALRWVGREMALRLRPLDTPDYAERAVAEFRRVEAALTAVDASSGTPAAGVADACWTVATTSSRGCPSRWYFLGLTLS